MISVEKSLWKLLKDAPTPITIKIFLYLALNQPDEGSHGFRITKIQLAVDLNLKKTQIFESLKWLKDNLLVQELKMADDFDFMVNPVYIMNNCDKKERYAEWNRRCNLDSERELRLRLQKLRRERKKASQQ